MAEVVTSDAACSGANPMTEASNPEDKHLIEVQWVIKVEPWMPNDEEIGLWAVHVLKTLGMHTVPAEVCVRVVSEVEIQALNREYREMDKVTNVLAFPQSIELDVGANLLGDIVICAPVVEIEADLQGKEASAHFTHLIVHGMLHLLGYDHIEDDEAEEMEKIEVQILKGLRVADPYSQEKAPNR